MTERTASAQSVGVATAGLIFTKDTVRSVCVTRNAAKKYGISVLAATQVALPTGSMRGHRIVDLAAVSEGVRTACTVPNYRITTANFCLPDSTVALTTMQTGIIPLREKRVRLFLQQQYPAADIDTYAVDWHKRTPRITGVVATPRAMVSMCEAAIEVAGFRSDSCEPASAAAFFACAVLHGRVRKHAVLFYRVEDTVFYAMFYKGMLMYYNRATQTTAPSVVTDDLKSRIAARRRSHTTCFMAIDDAPLLKQYADALSWLRVIDILPALTENGVSPTDLPALGTAIHALRLRKYR